MAISETRTLGSGGGWLGVNVISNLGLVVVLRNKVLQASAAIADVLNEVTLFYGDYNPAADFVSRQRWPEPWRFCALLGFLLSP